VYHDSCASRFATPLKCYWYLKTTQVDNSRAIECFTQTACQSNRPVVPKVSRHFPRFRDWNDSGLRPGWWRITKEPRVIKNYYIARRLKVYDNLPNEWFHWVLLMEQSLSSVSCCHKHLTTAADRSECQFHSAELTGTGQRWQFQTAKLYFSLANELQ